MKLLLLFLTALTSGLIGSPSAYSFGPPAGYPIVKGEVRKINLGQGRISIRHEEIPNLSMPPMTMSFAVDDVSVLSNLSVGDKINFVADEIDGELTALWIEKNQSVTKETSSIRCFGIAPTTPKTRIEVHLRKNKYSTIRYEFAEGAYAGTAYVNSIGHLELAASDLHYRFAAGDSELSTALEFQRNQYGQISDAKFTHFNSGMKRTPVTCEYVQ